ncbi:MAG: hypothetical protein QM760_12420 [Nibricoccus sp.]
MEELRWTLVKCAVVYGIFAVAIGIYLKEFNDVLLWPLNHAKVDFPSADAGPQHDLGDGVVYDCDPAVLSGRAGSGDAVFLYFSRTIHRTGPDEEGAAHDPAGEPGGVFPVFAGRGFRFFPVDADYHQQCGGVESTLSASQRGGRREATTAC